MTKHKKNSEKIKTSIVFLIIILLLVGFLAYGFYNKNNSSDLAKEVAECLS